MERMIAIHWDFHPNRFFDLLQVLILFPITERDAFAACSCASGAADTMHVGLCFHRHIVIDHMTDLIDVDLASCNV
ncbi:MAG: hypothetical protein RLY14_2680, partial [Planctomycetota bacterium]